MIVVPHKPANTPPYAKNLQMRTISLVNRLKWSFTGNLNPHALAIGDVDNDGDNEFVIGNLNGDLAIFKGECPNGTPTFQCKDLGTITCVAVGDVRNHGKNSVICISAEGSAHIFDFPFSLAETTSYAAPSLTPAAALIAQEQAQLKQRRGSSDTSTILSSRIKEKSSAWSIGKGGFERPMQTLSVPVNVNRILIADIDGDGLNELVLARTDRMLHSYQLSAPITTSSPASSNPTTAAPTPAPSSRSTTRAQSETFASPTPSRSTSSRSGAPVHSRTTTVSDHRSSSPVPQETLRSRRSQSSLNPERVMAKPHLIDRGTWFFTGQITSLTITKHPERPEEPLLVVAQPGNTFVIVDREGNWLDHDLKPHAEAGGYKCGVKKFGVMEGADGANWVVGTEIATGKRRGGREMPDLLGLVSMDGTFKTYDLATLAFSNHELQVTHKLFNLVAINLAHSSPHGLSAHHNPPSPSTGFGHGLSDVHEEGQSELDEDNQGLPLHNGRRIFPTMVDKKSRVIAEEEEEEQFEDDMFVVCSWNGTTYLADWATTSVQTGRKQSVGRVKKGEEKVVEGEALRMVKFEFEGRVCAFSAGPYAVHSGHNVPCLFYVDFEDQIFVYWDIHLSLRPVLGFLDAVDKSVLDEIVLAEKIVKEDLLGEKMQQDLPGFVYQCIYDFDGLKAQLEEAASKPVQPRSSSTKSSKLVEGPGAVDGGIESPEIIEVKAEEAKVTKQDLTVVDSNMLGEMAEEDKEEAKH